MTHVVFPQVMSYSSFIFTQASVAEDVVQYAIVGNGTINVIATIIAVSSSVEKENNVAIEINLLNILFIYTIFRVLPIYFNYVFTTLYNAL